MKFDLFYIIKFIENSSQGFWMRISLWQSKVQVQFTIIGYNIENELNDWCPYWIGSMGN